MKTEYVIAKGELSIDVLEDTRFVLELTDGLTTEIILRFVKPGVSAEILGLYLLKGDEKVVLTTIAHHIATNTKCTTNIRGVLLDASRSDYIGKILIDKSAQQTVSYLDDKVLVLGDNVKNTSQPILEIDADDVKASHGATTGKLDKTHLFYLQSRGFSYEEAKNIIVRGFFTEVLLELSQDERDAILKKLRI